MDDKHFHNVDPDVLKKITVNDILTGDKITPVQIDYSVQVPTRNQSLPRLSKKASLYPRWGGLDYASLPELDPGYRGRLGGC